LGHEGRGKRRLFSYASQFASDPSSFSEEDKEVNTVLSPEELLLLEYNIRRDAFLKQPLSVWTAMYVFMVGQKGYNVTGNLPTLVWQNINIHGTI
jgi:hypothetical protein